MSNYPQRVLSLFLDIVFPKKCLGCGKFTAVGDFDYVCKKCLGKIENKNTLECIGCKRQTQYGFTCEFCKKGSFVDQLVVAAELANPLIEKMLKTHKYGFISEMNKPLLIVAQKSIKKLLLKGFNLFEDNPLLVPVPLHDRRLNWRGFNQAELLAKNLSDMYHISCDNSILNKITDSKHQADIKTREERLNNIKNSFALKNGQLIKNKTIVLVDDICTTGATLNECTKVLKSGGAKRIIGFVIARGRFKN